MKAGLPAGRLCGPTRLGGALMGWPGVRHVVGMRLQALALGLSLIAAAAAGCANPACEEAVVVRVYDDCRLSSSSASAAGCVGLPGTPEAEADYQGALRGHLTAACELNDPEVDAECLKTETCEAIAAGACTTRSSPSAARRTCALACAQTEQDCIQACSTAASWGACTDCELSCVGSGEDCTDACPE